MMWSVCFREYVNLFKSVKSILITLFMIISSYVLAYFIDKFNAGIFEEKGVTSLASLLLIVLITGFLLVFSASHDVLSRELNSRTIRFLVTKTNRDNIVYGKFFGVFFFWLTCIFIASMAISTITRTFDVIAFLQVIIFMTYPITLCMLLSVVFSRPGYTMFIGLFVSLTLPAVSIWSMGTDNMFVSWLKYLSPYFYSAESDYKQFVSLILSAIFLILTIIIFRERDF